MRVPPEARWSTSASLIDSQLTSEAAGFRGAASWAWTAGTRQSVSASSATNARSDAFPPDQVVR